MSLAERWTSRLEELRRLDRFRSFRTPAGIDFTSNDYLGYASDFPELAGESLSRSGAASRLLRGNHPIWEEVESQLAEWHGAESVLMMTSGYAANEGLLATILEPGDWAAVDERIHACLVDGLRLARCRRFSFAHNDLQQLEEGLKKEAEKQESGRERFIVTESLFSMDGDLAPLTEMAQLAERYGAKLIVDEAHATGCYGGRGSGLVDELGLRNRVLATVHTGGKALGVPGAYIACSRLLKDYLVNHCRHLIFTTALAPECGRWWLSTLARVQVDTEGRRQLHENAGHFRAELTSRGIVASGTTYVVPWIVGADGTAVEIARTLQTQGFDIRAIRPPTVAPGTSRLRISVHANHDLTTLTQLAELCSQANVIRGES